MHRRQFLALACAFVPTAWSRVRAPAASLPGPLGPAPGNRAALDPTTLRRWVAPLPLLRVAEPAASVADAAGAAVPLYRVTMAETRWRFHPDLPPTRVWTYDGVFPGPTLVAHSGAPVRVDWRNALPARHFLPVDHTLMGAGPDVPEVRTVVHLHGGRVPHASDGYPEDWRRTGEVQSCRYPNTQDAATLWYHDHAMGINRLNVFAGLFGMALLRDAAEARLGLPAGSDELALALCDREFDREGQLLYPVSGDPRRPWIPEFFGNAIVCNGALWPHCSVRPGVYRWRLLNASNARFLDLSFPPAVRVRQIGADQGLLDAPAPLQRLTLAPAERADLLVDFSAAAGATVFLNNDDVAVMRVQVASAAPRPAGGGASAPWPQPAPPAMPARTRRIVLREYYDAEGRTARMLIDGKRWREPVSERPALGSVEIWEIVNTSDDTHPIHWHMVRCRVLDRRSFDEDEFLGRGVLRFLAPPVPPQPGERGWKDTVRATGGMVTRVAIAFAGYPGRYLFHCHILEHEANEMMRPFEVVPPEPAASDNLENPAPAPPIHGGNA